MSLLVNKLNRIEFAPRRQSYFLRFCLERMPFIEGYAHLGQWQQAAQLTQQSADVTPLMRPLLCGLWTRIAQTTPASQPKDLTVKALQPELHCPS